MKKNLEKLLMRNTILSLEEIYFLHKNGIFTFADCVEMTFIDFMCLPECTDDLASKLSLFVTEVNNAIRHNNEDYLDYFKEKALKIEEIDLSARACNALKKTKIEYVHELLDVDFFDLIKTRGLGVKTCKEIIGFIKMFKVKELKNKPKKESDRSFFNYAKYVLIAENKVSNRMLNTCSRKKLTLFMI